MKTKASLFITLLFLCASSQVQAAQDKSAYKYDEKNLLRCQAEGYQGGELPGGDPSKGTIPFVVSLYGDTSVPLASIDGAKDAELLVTVSPVNGYYTVSVYSRTTEPTRTMPNGDKFLSVKEIFSATARLHEFGSRLHFLVPSPVPDSASYVASVDCVSTTQMVLGK